KPQAGAAAVSRDPDAAAPSRPRRRHLVGSWLPGRWLVGHRLRGRWLVGRLLGGRRLAGALCSGRLRSRRLGGDGLGDDRFRRRLVARGAPSPGRTSVAVARTSIAVSRTSVPVTRTGIVIGHASIVVGRGSMGPDRCDRLGWLAGWYGARA